jgi:hypothetical protein
MDATQRRVWKLKLLGIVIGIIILIPDPGVEMGPAVAVVWG